MILKEKDIKRFWSKVDVKYKWTKNNRRIKDKNKCWNWTASLFKHGYGQFSISKDGNKKKLYAHRFSWMIHFGKIVSGLLVCHKCDNRCCCNPNHLFTGTMSDNMKDCVNKNRHVYPNNKGENNSGSKLKEIQIREIRSLYYNKDISYNEIGRVYNISGVQARNIIVEKSWSHI